MTKRFFSFLLASLMLLTAFSVTAAGPEAITGSISVTNRHPGIGDSVRATVEIANHTDAAVTINEFKLTNKDEVLMEYAALPEPNGGGFSSGGRASSKNITVVGGVSSGGGGGGGSLVTPFSGIIEAGQSMTKDITFTVGELPVELKLTASSEAIGSSIELASLTLTQQEEKAAEGAITLSKQFPMPGETITATASITNHTGKAIDFSSIRLMREDKNLLAPESTGQEDTPPAELTASIGAGETKSWNAEVEITVLPIELKLIVASEELGTEVVLASVTIEDAVNLELSEINQLQKDSTDSALVFELTGTVSNLGNHYAANVTVEVENAAAVYGTTQISEIAAGVQQPFTLTAAVPKADFSEETLELSIKAKCGDKSAEKTVTLTNTKYLKDIIVNNGQALKIVEGKTFTIPEDFVAFVPETAATAYSIESLNQEIATVSEDGKTVTAVKKGEAKLKVTAGKVVKEVGLTVTPGMKNGEPVSYTHLDVYKRQKLNDMK